MNGALSDLTVLDVTHVLAGPFCSYQMALLGADVIKIEPVHAPDCARGRGADNSLNAAGLGLTYQVQGANKRSLAINLSDPRGRDIVRDLARSADVFLENYTTGALEGLGLSYETLAALNPQLIYCSMTGFGDEGEKAQTGAYDNVIQAASGIIAQSDGHKPGVSFVDYASGYSAAFAIMAAIHQRSQTGRGSYISASMFEVAMSLMAPEAAATQIVDPAKRSKEAGISRYKTADGELMLGAFKPDQYRKLAKCLAQKGHSISALSNVEAWTDVWELPASVFEELTLIFRTLPTRDWLALFAAADIPAEPISTLVEAAAHPQLLTRGYFVPSPGDAKVKLPLAAYKMSEGGPKLTKKPPVHGQDSVDILIGLGFEDAAITELIKEGVVL